MFKKAVDVRGQQRLSGADRKKLRRTIREKFPHATEEDLDLILPPKGDVVVHKMVNRALLYAAEGGPPLLFDADGRGHDIYPTVFYLWKAPQLIPCFLLKGAEVSCYLLSGADLMLPGVQVQPGGFPQFGVGEVWGVRVPGNNMPIAVGSTLITSAAADKGGKGRLLHITHFYQDWLWESAEGSYVPNPGFEKDIVRGYPANPAESEEGGDGEGGAGVLKEEVEESKGQGDGEMGRGGKGASVVAGALEGEIYRESMQALRLEERNQQGAAGPQGLAGAVAGPAQGNGETAAMGETAAPATAAASAAAAAAGGVDDIQTEAASLQEPMAASTPEQMDALLDQCLMQALCTSVKANDLPLPASTLWSSHILPCRPPGVVLDVKKSSHKKLSKWLQSKTTQGLISGKEDKHRKEFVLSSINYTHPDLVAFEPLRPPAAAPQQPTTGGVSTEEAQKGAERVSGPGGTVEVEEVWKSSSHVGPILDAIGADRDRFYTASETRQLALDYVQKQNLVKPGDPSTVVLDPFLCDALFKGAIKKGAAYPTEIHFKDLGPQFLSRMQAHHRVTRGSKSAVKKGALQSVQIVSERRQGNKKVTRVTGLESYFIEPESLAVELQKRFACSTSVAEVPGKKGQHEVLVQGGVIEELGRLLMDRYGVPRRHIEVLDKAKR